MRRVLTIVAFAGLISLIQAAEARAGASGIDRYATFSGPAFTGTVVLDPDASSAGKGTVAIRISRGNTGAGVIFDSAFVGGFANGCDGENGASTPSDPPTTVEALTNTRFLGTDAMLSDDAKKALLQQFGITPDLLHPLVFSDISGATCTRIPAFDPDNPTAPGVWILSFTGTMQFGKKLQ
jgi:hypothetical protein